MIMKISRSNLFNLSLAIIVIASVFLVNISSSGIWPYEPWWDVNADGVIDIQDVARVSGAFGTFGDSTKNVTVAGHANKLAYSISDQYIVEDGSFSTPWISVDGYSKVSISLYSGSAINQYVLMAKHTDGFVFRVDAMDNVTFHFSKAYDIPNELISVFYQDYSGFESWIYIDIYLIA